MSPPPESPLSPAAHELAETCVRESRITTHRDASFRTAAGASLGAATLLGAALVDTPHLGLISLALNASAFVVLQGAFHQ